MAPFRTDPFVCILCGSGLPAPNSSHVQCTGCRTGYPMIAPGIPMLLENPDDHCAIAVAELLGQAEYIASAIHFLEDRLAVGGKRPQALRRILDMMRASSELVRKLLSMLPSEWPSEQLTRPLPYSIQLDLQYLVRDWGGRPKAEGTIASVMSALRRQLVHAPLRDSVLVLGAGTGRYAWELTADFTDVLALDWSIASVLSHTLVAQGSINLHERNEQNVASIEDLAIPVRCTLPSSEGLPREERLSRLRWVVADGRRVPLPPESCAVVLSAYYSDVVLPDVLLQEAWRLLRPGGTFVHFGPLGYQHGDLEEMPTAEEFMALFAERGFSVTPCEWVPHWFWPTERLFQAHINAFAFSAVKP